MSIDPSDTTFFDRCIYAFIGFVSGGLLGAVSWFLFRPGIRILSNVLNLDPVNTWIAYLAVPVAFALLMALFGFISPSRLSALLERWWARFV